MYQHHAHKVHISAKLQVMPAELPCKNSEARRMLVDQVRRTAEAFAPSTLPLLLHMCICAYAHALSRINTWVSTAEHAAPKIGAREACGQTSEEPIERDGPHVGAKSIV